VAVAVAVAVAVDVSVAVACTRATTSCFGVDAGAIEAITTPKMISSRPSAAPPAKNRCRHAEPPVARCHKSLVACHTARSKFIMLRLPSFSSFHPSRCPYSLHHR
jgi:hypothetical protein